MAKDISRLLQEWKALQKEEKEEKKKLEDAQKKLIQKERLNKICYLGHPGKEYLGNHGKWELNPFQKIIFDTFKKEFITNKWFNHLVLTGVNQFGKTASEVFIIFTCFFGRYPWEPEDTETWFWNSRGWNPDNQKIRINWIGQDWNQVDAVLLAKFWEWCPDVIYDYGYGDHKNPLGKVDRIYCDRFDLYITSDRAETLEGPTYHVILADEPIYRETYSTVIRGLQATNGIFIMGATLLGVGSDWITNDLINQEHEGKHNHKNLVHLNNIDPKLNVGYGISDVGQANFDQQLADPEERAIRLAGTAHADLFRVIPKFGPLNIIKPFKVPRYWPVTVMADYASSKPWDITFIALDTVNRAHVIYCTTIRGTGTEVAKQCIDIAKVNDWNLIRSVLDPLSKGDTNSDEFGNTSFEKFESEFFHQNHQAWVKTRSKSKDAGILQWNSNILTDNGTANFFIFDTCARTINQCYRWRYHPKTMIPIKKDDDQPENIYGFYLETISYEEFLKPNYGEDEEEIEKNRPVTRRWGI